MIRFEFLDKSRTDEFLPQLFDLLYNNMNAIAPSGFTREEDWEEWRGAVGPALQKEPRKIILIYSGDKLIGYFQYFVNAETFMMEEIQLKPEFHGTGVFEKLYEHLYGIVPKETPFAEAYAHKLNLRSQGILLHLGLEPIGENRNGSCLHYRGSCAKMFDIILKRGAED